MTDLQTRIGERIADEVEKVAGPDGKFSLGALAEVATKAIYTHGFGFREVVGPCERGGKVAVNFCWDDDTLVRAMFWLDPTESPTSTTTDQEGGE